MNRVSIRLTYAAATRDRARGLSHLENPYLVGTPEHETWLRGWGGGPHPSVAPQFTTHTPVRRDS